MACSRGATPLAQSKHGHMGAGGVIVVEEDACAPRRLARNSLCRAMTYASSGVLAYCRGGTPLQQSAQGHVDVFEGRVAKIPVGCAVRLFVVSAIG